MVSFRPPIAEPGQHNRVIGRLWLQRESIARPSGFSLIELMVVIAVVTLLTSLMLPALSHVRENARRVVCASNLHNMGVGLQTFYDDHNERYPYSAYGNPEDPLYAPQQMMAVHRGHLATAWDGLGLLFQGQYCNAPQCFYCPSHTGEHQFERYENSYYWPGAEPIYGNYQYAGHMDMQSKQLRRAGLRNGHELVLVADGLRTASDFNHRTGTNVLRTDVSVKWYDDSAGLVVDALPTSPDLPTSVADPIYSSIWATLENPATSASASTNPNHH